MSARVFESQSFIISRNWIIINLRRIQFAIQEEQLYAECGARLKNSYLSKLPCICPSPYNFRMKNPNKARYIASTEISYQFLAPKVPVLRRNKATNSSSSTDSLYSLYVVIYSSMLDLPSHSHVQFVNEIMKRIRGLSDFLNHYPQVANFPCESDVKS